VYLGFGGGVEFNLAQNLALRATLEQIQIRNAVSNTAFLGGRNGDFDVNEGSVGLLMYF
jgi:opacity protein-like surface antigen